MRYFSPKAQDIERKNTRLAKHLILATLRFSPVVHSGQTAELVPPNLDGVGGGDALFLWIDRYLKSQIMNDFFRRPNAPPHREFTMDVAMLAVAIGRRGSVFVHGGRKTARQVIEPLLRLEGWRIRDGKEASWEIRAESIDLEEPAANATYRKLIDSMWVFDRSYDKRSFQLVVDWFNGERPPAEQLKDTDLEDQLQ